MKVAQNKFHHMYMESSVMKCIKSSRCSSVPVSNATGGNEKKQQIKFSQFMERKQTQTMDINI